LPAILNLYLRALVGAVVLATIVRLPAGMRRFLTRQGSPGTRSLWNRLTTLPPARSMTLGLLHSFRYRVDRARRVYAWAPS
jgi:hypothetical protein